MLKQTGSKYFFSKSWIHLSIITPSFWQPPHLSTEFGNLLQKRCHNIKIWLTQDRHINASLIACNRRYELYRLHGLSKKLNPERTFETNLYFVSNMQLAYIFTQRCHGQISQMLRVLWKNWKVVFLLLDTYHLYVCYNLTIIRLDSPIYHNQWVWVD